MGAPYNGLTSTNDVLIALKTRIGAVKWTPPTVGANPQDAFDKIELFDMTNLLQAIQELLLFKNRICLIVHDLERFETEFSGNEVRCKQRRDIILLIADRSFKNRKLALSGDATTPGVLTLKDLLIPTVVGLLSDGIVVTPGDGELMALEGRTRDEAAGRIAYRQNIEVKGGLLQFVTGRKPIV